jgi:hypothetical protein
VRAWLWDGQAGLDHLHLDEVPDPVPQEGEHAHSSTACSRSSSCRTHSNALLTA